MATKRHPETGQYISHSATGTPLDDILAAPPLPTPVTPPPTLTRPTSAKAASIDMSDPGITDVAP